MSFKDKLDLEKLPKHIAIIMDGNGRWAKKQNKLRVFGHKNGVSSVREATEAAAEIGVEYVTLYAFSKENWKRPSFEVNALMSLLIETLTNEIKTLNKNNIRLKAIGDLTRLPSKTHRALLNGIEITKDNTRMTLVLALNYSGKWDITQATQIIAGKVLDGTLNKEEISDTTIEKHLTTAGIPDPELMIRTSGERRISNFLLWQLAYAEMYFTEVLWPDFRKENLYEAIVDFQNRERRFGKTGEQITNG